MDERELFGLILESEKLCEIIIDIRNHLKNINGIEDKITVATTKTSTMVVVETELYKDMLNKQLQKLYVEKSKKMTDIRAAINEIAGLKLSR